jgi:hypothetical protein
MPMLKRVEDQILGLRPATLRGIRLVGFVVLILVISWLTGHHLREGAVAISH